MKDTLTHYRLTIEAQKKQIDELMEERDILKRSCKQVNKANAELWDLYLSEIAGSEKLRLSILSIRKAIRNSGGNYESSDIYNIAVDALNATNAGINNEAD